MQYINNGNYNANFEIIFITETVIRIISKLSLDLLIRKIQFGSMIAESKL